MSLRTTPFTRDELIEQAERVHAGALAVIGHSAAMSQGRANLVYEAEALAAIVDALKNYPLAKFAEEVVNVVLGDLSMRRGFDDLILTEDFRAVRRFLIEKVAQTVVGPVNPFPDRLQRMLKLESEEELHAVAPAPVPQQPTPPAASTGDDLDFA